MRTSETIFMIWIVLCSGAIIFGLILPAFRAYVLPGIETYLAAGL